ncbi:MAG: helix-turn-helix domain-containing protein [Christensenellales bacterium]
MVKFGERMKAARTAKHMSQQALADIIGKSLNTVGLYERGLRQPSLETLCLLADTLEVSSDYLLARTDVKRTATFSGVSESDLAARVARIENHLGLEFEHTSRLHPFYFVFSKWTIHMSKNAFQNAAVSLTASRRHERGRFRPLFAEMMKESL